MQLLQQMIDTGQFSAFIDGMQEAQNDDTMWDFYLHKVNENISFDTFKARLVQSVPVKASKNDLEATVKHSFEMMENFRPEE